MEYSAFINTINKINGNDNHYHTVDMKRKLRSLGKDGIYIVATVTKKEELVMNLKRDAIKFNKDNIMTPHEFDNYCIMCKTQGISLPYVSFDISVLQEVAHSMKSTIDDKNSIISNLKDKVHAFKRML